MAASVPAFAALTTVEAFRKAVNEHFAKQITEGAIFDPRDIQRFNEVDGYTRMFIEHSQLGKTFDEEKGFQVFHDAMVWRKQNNAFDVSTDKFPASYFERRGIFYENHDLQNCRILNFVIRKFNKAQEDSDAVKRFITYHFEEQLRHFPGQRIVILFDMSDTGLRHLDYDQVKFIMAMLLTYYPGLLSYIMVFRLPFILRAAWQLIRSWMPTETQNGVKFVDEKTIMQYAAPDQVWKAMGGTAADTA